MKKIKLPEGVTQEQFDSWKSKWGELIEVIEAPLSRQADDTTLVVVKSPENDRNVCGQFERHIDSNPDKAREILLSNCVLGPQADKVKENNFAFRAVSMYLIEKIPVATVKVKN